MKKMYIKLAALTGIAAIVLFGISLYQPTKVKAGTPVQVTVRILRVIEIDCDEGVGVPCPNDPFAKVNIANQGFESSPHEDNNADFSPYWQFTRTVDSDLGTIPIDIELWDFDSFLSMEDNLIDISAGDSPLHLMLDLSTGNWTGEVPQNVGFSTGEGDDSSKILFDISLSGNGDFDSDGIPDSVERFGVRDGNGNVVADMAAMGADPCRPTIAVEIDYMADAAHTHRPLTDAINEVVAAFNAAPVDPAAGCPYPGFPTNSGQGVNIVLDVDDQLAEQSPVNFGAMGAQNAEAIRNMNFQAERRPYFHYSLWAHSRVGTTSSGVCCSDSSKDFIVSLGAFQNQVGDVREQSGTLMHELGHALGLDHGGGRDLDPSCNPNAPATTCLDEINCKPNYLSIMSYAFQFTGVLDPTLPANNIDILINATGAAGKDGIPDNRGRLDYSRGVLPDLNESMLLENNGIGDGTDLTLFADPTGTVRSSAGNAPINWNWNFDTAMPPAPIFDVGSVAVNINNVRSDCGGAPTGETLRGYDDWENIKYRAVLSPNANLGGVGSDEELTAEAVRELLAVIAEALKPDPSVSMTVAPDPVLTGSNVTYTITLRNNRPTQADNVVVTDNLPATMTFVSCAATNGGICSGVGNDRTITFAQLPGNAMATITIVANIACAVSDGTSIANQVSITSATPDADTGNNSATVSFTTSNPPPVISNVTVDQGILWTPNHQMRDVVVSYTVTDNCGTPNVFLSVTSNEPINGLGDGDVAPDWEIVNANKVRLRAERSGKGTGRIYTIRITAVDSGGGSSAQDINVLVPHSQGN